MIRSLSWLYFSSSVRSCPVRGRPLPAGSFRAPVTSLHDCIVSMQALAFAGSFHFAKSGPPPSLSRCSMTGSRNRAQQVEWCRCTVHVHVYTSRSDRLLFRLAALRPSEGPQRSALVARVWRPSGPSRAPWNIIASLCVCVCVCSLHECMSFKQQFEWRLHATSF